MALQVQAAPTEKFLVRNNTAGWIGVIKLNHRGEEIGDAVEPYGTVWLSEDEMILTARAPRLPEDNPFAEWVLLRVNPETQAREEFKIRPLTLVSNSDRYTPAEDRYVPTVDAPQEAAPAQRQEAATAPAIVAGPISSAPAAAPAPPPAPPVSEPPPGPPLRGTPATPDDTRSWLATPEAPGQVLSGHLDGSNDVPDRPERAPEPTLAPAERFVPSVIGAQAAPQTPGAGEEFAALVDPEIGEETGRARPPVEDAPAGEYARAEEVGTPDAPTRPTQDEE
jgi:hypothetical protein